MLEAAMEEFGRSNAFKKGNIFMGKRHRPSVRGALFLSALLISLLMAPMLLAFLIMMAAGYSSDAATNFKWFGLIIYGCAILFFVGGGMILARKSKRLHLSDLAIATSIFCLFNVTALSDLYLSALAASALILLSGLLYSSYRLTRTC